MFTMDQWNRLNDWLGEVANIIEVARGLAVGISAELSYGMDRPGQFETRLRLAIDDLDRAIHELVLGLADSELPLMPPRLWKPQKLRRLAEVLSVAARWPEDAVATGDTGGGQDGQVTVPGGQQADDETRTTLLAMERWKRTAADEVDNIGGWRDADPGDRLHKFWSDPARQKDTEPGSTMPRHFELDTTYLLGRLWDEDPKRDLTPLREVYAAVSAWHADHSAERIPEQRVLVQSLEDAMLVVRAVESQLSRRLGRAGDTGGADDGASSAAPSGSQALPLVPTPLAKLFEQFDMLLVTAGMLRREVKRLEQAEAAGELSEAIRRGWFPDKGCRLHPAESEVLRAEPHRDPVLKSIQLNRDLQRCGQEVFKHLPSAVDWLDDPADAAQKRWTVRVDADVRELLGCLYRGQPNDVELSDLPWPDQGIVDAMWPVMERLERLLHDLKSVERTRAAPIAVPVSLASTYRGDLDEAEVAAVHQLGDRDIWGVDELPETIDADMLRCLDRHGMVQTRIVVMQNQAKHPGDRTPPRPSPQGWVSPIQQPELAGDWDAVVAWHIRDSQRYPSQVRLSDVGKAERAKVQRSMAKAASADQESKRLLIRLPPPETDTEESDFPVPDPSTFPTDLEHLEGWGKRLDKWCESEKPPNRNLWTIFRPDRATADAMMRLSIKFPLVMRQVHDTLDFVEKHFDPMKSGEPGADESFNGGLLSLKDRILAAVATIRGVEAEPGEEESDSHKVLVDDDTPEVVERWTQGKVIKAAKHHLKRNPFPGVNAMALILGCPSSTLSVAISADPELSKVRDEYQQNRKPRGASVRAGQAGAAIEAVGAEMAVPESMEDRAQGVLHRLLDEYEPKKDRPAAEEVVKLRGGEMRKLLISAMEADDPDGYKAASDAVQDLIRQGVHERSRSRTPRESP